MSFKTTYIMFGILGAILIGFALLLFLGPTAPPDKSFIFPSANSEAQGKVTSSDVDRLEIVRKEPTEETLVFERVGEGENKQWRMTSPVKSTVDPHAVDSIARQVLEARRDEKAELTKNLKDWGLQPPAAVVTLEAKGKTYKLNLGNRSPGKSSAVIYVTSSDNPKTPMAVLANDLDAAYKDINEYRSRELFGLGFDKIHGVRVEQPAKKEQVILTSTGKNQWRYEKPNYGTADYEGGSEGAEASKALNGVKALLSAITSMRIEGKTAPLMPEKDKPAEKKKGETGFVEDNAKDLKKYGVENEADASLVLAIKGDADSKDEQILLIGKEVEKTDLYYARLVGDTHVVTVSKKSLEPFRELLGNPEAVRDRDLVKIPEGEQLDVIRITFPDKEQIELVKTSGGGEKGPHGFAMPDTWKLYRNKDKKGIETDARAVENLVSAFKQKRQIKDFPAKPDDPVLGLEDKNNLTVALWFNGIKKAEPKKDDDKDKKEEKDKKDDKKEDKKEEKKEEKKDEDRPELKNDKGDVVLVFGKVDSKNLAAIKRLTGKDLKDSLVAKVQSSVLELARADQLTYFDKTLPPFVTNTDAAKNIVKITTEFDGKITEAVRSKPEDASSEWILKKPVEWDGRKADLGVIQTLPFKLGDLPLTKWESLKPTPEQLGRWGLKTPTARWTLTVKDKDGKTSDVSLLIGGPTDDKNGLYAKKSDADAVFVLNRNDVEKLKESLLELQVMKFDLAEVKSIKLTGWERKGTPDVLELTMDGANWEGKYYVAGVKDKPTVVKPYTDKVNNLLQAMSTLKAKKFVVFKGTAKEAAERGADVTKGGVTIEVTTEKDKKPEVYSLTIGNVEPDGVFAISNKLPGDVFSIAKGTDDLFEKIKKDSEYLAK